MKIHGWIENVIKHNEIVQLLYRIIFSNVFKFIGLFIKKNNKLILFTSYGGRQFSDSPKVLYEAIKKDERFKDFECVWAFENPTNYINKVEKCIKVDSLQYFIIALKAAVWITNVNIERGLRFKKEPNVYINTWHGTGPKQGGNSRKGRHDYDFSNVDILCCDGEYLKMVFEKSFNALSESMFYGGKPREDELYRFTQADADRIKSTLGISDDRKILLYMPTFRENTNLEPDWELWKKTLSKNFIVLVRTHHFNQSCVYEGKNSFMIDVTAYENVNELYWISDGLISDYSSSFFDYGLLKRPMFCFAPDYDEYTLDPGLYFDLEKEFPNGIARTDLELMEKIKKMAINYAGEAQKAGAFCDKYVHHEYGITEKCVDELYRKMIQKGLVE